MVYIDAVRYAIDYYGNKLYISHVKWTNDLCIRAVKTCDKQAMIDFIEKQHGQVKTKYYRNGRWIVGEDVHVVEHAYLRTDANNIKADNLENLPEF